MLRDARVAASYQGTPATGLTNGLLMGFLTEADANAADPLLAALPASARATLLAEPTGDGYRLDVRLRGERETVFFDV